MRTAVFIVCALLALASSTACVPRFGSGNSARVNSLEGNGELLRNGGKWEPARLWQTVRSGDRARTSSHGKIDFSLGNYRGVLTLMPETTVEFERLGPATPDSSIVAVLNLIEGRVVGETLKLPPDRRIQVKTRTAVFEIP